MISQINMTSDPTRIHTSGGRAAPGVRPGCKLGTLLRLPRVRRLHADAGIHMPRIRKSATQGSSSRPVSRAGVSCLLMAWHGKTGPRAPAATEALTRQPVSRPDGDGLLPPQDDAPGDSMSYTYTTDLAAIRAVVHRYAIKAGLTEIRAIDLVLAVSEVAANTIRHAKSPGSLKIWYDTEE